MEAGMSENTHRLKHKILYFHECNTYDFSFNIHSKKNASIYIIHTHTFRKHKIMQIKSETFKTVNKRFSKVFTTLTLVNCIY